MAYLKSSQITGLSAKDVDVKGFTQAGTLKLGDRAYTEHEVLLADNYNIVGDVTVSEDLILSKLSDDGDDITITGDTTTRTITGSGSIQGATLAQTPNATLTGMTGELGSAVQDGITRLGSVTTGSIGSGVTGLTGVKYAETWRLHTAFTSTAAISANIERDDAFGFGRIGDGMSHNGSGVWTFPSTGLWQVISKFQFSTTHNKRYWRHNIRYSSDSGSSFSPAEDSTTGCYAYTSGTHFTTAINLKHFAITNTSTQKIQFGIEGEYGSGGTVAVTTAGHTTLGQNYMSFIRLGDL